MAIQSNYEYKGVTYDKVTFKIVRVFGSKREGWNAVFAFVPEGEDFEEKNFKGLISIGAAWSEDNPYVTLYKQMEAILIKGGFTVSNDIETVKVQEYVEPTKAEVAVEDQKPKKTRTKKVKKDVGIISK